MQHSKVYRRFQPHTPHSYRSFTIWQPVSTSSVRHHQSIIQEHAAMFVHNFTRIHSVGAELFHADGQTDRHDESNCRFSQF